MLPANKYSLLHRRTGQNFPRIQVVPYLPEYPWVTNSRPAYHDPVHPIPVFIFPGFLRAVDIPISKDGDLYPRIVLYFTDQDPIGLSFIQFTTPPSINCQALNSYSLLPHRHFSDAFRILSPSPPSLH